MKPSLLSLPWTVRPRFLPARVGYPALALALSLTFAASAADFPKSFDTPEAAVAALVTATDARDTNALAALFGPKLAEIRSSDPVQAANELEAFGQALSQSYVIVRGSESRCELELGEDAWLFPVPLVNRDGQWYFDTEAGREELLNRRIGRNELETLAVMRAYVGAQREYASADRDGDEVLEYAQRLISSPGATDGLYWSPDLGLGLSPLGPLVAQAQSEGYRPKSREEDSAPQPYHGYFFKILTRQGKHAPGGKYHCIINGNMIGGFALVAWPSSYGETGIMTFLVNQQGRVYQCDLGPRTDRVAAGLKAYDPDSAWAVSPD